MVYIAGPPVFREKDYYRDDDRIIEQLIRGQETKTLFIGIRRCGKTSLLKKVNYRFSEDSVFLSLQGTSEFIEKRILLLDEFEELKADLRKFSIIKEFLQSHESDRVIIATCSTQIFEPNSNDAGDEDNVLTFKQFMRLMEEFETRYIRGLTRDEINALCRQSRDRDISFDLEHGLIKEIIGHLGAFTQPLQYVCKNWKSEPVPNFPQFPNWILKGEMCTPPQFLTINSLIRLPVIFINKKTG